MAEAALIEKFGDAGYERIRLWLNERCGIHYAEKKKELLAQRLARVLERFNIDNLDDLAIDVETGLKEEVQLAVMHAASTNHTYFFREPQVLKFFSDSILPLLAHQREVRIWSAATATGDEAYTLAMLIAEALGCEQAANCFSILGTDISAPVIKHAESAIYGMSHLEQTPEHFLNRYFAHTDDNEYRIVPQIRPMCTFRRLNLKAQPYPFRRLFDVVFCRNVLYYFDHEHQYRTLEALYNATEPGGWLLTSLTESVRDMGTRWCWVGGGIYRKLA